MASFFNGLFLLTALVSLESNNMSYTCMYELLKELPLPNISIRAKTRGTGGFTKHKLLRYTLQYHFSQ